MLIVVATQGTCFTAGIELMFNSDVVIASDNSNLSKIAVQRGIMPFGGATVRFAGHQWNEIQMGANYRVRGFPISTVWRAGAAILSIRC